MYDQCEERFIATLKREFRSPGKAESLRYVQTQVLDQFACLLLRECEDWSEADHLHRAESRAFVHDEGSRTRSDSLIFSVRPGLMIFDYESITSTKRMNRETQFRQAFRKPSPAESLIRIPRSSQSASLGDRIRAGLYA